MIAWQLLCFKVCTETVLYVQKIVKTGMSNKK